MSKVKPDGRLPHSIVGYGLRTTDAFLRSTILARIDAELHVWSKWTAGEADGTDAKARGEARIAALRTIRDAFSEDE